MLFLACLAADYPIHILFKPSRLLLRVALWQCDSKDVPAINPIYTQPMLPNRVCYVCSKCSVAVCTAYMFAYYIYLLVMELLDFHFVRSLIHCPCRHYEPIWKSPSVFFLGRSVSHDAHEDLIQSKSSWSCYRASLVEDR